LSIRLYQRPPLTPFSSADTMRSVHTEASTHDDQSRASAPCLVLADTAGALPCLIAAFPHPPSCPAFPRRGFAVRTSRGWRRCGTMRALTPAVRSHARQVSPLPSLCLPSIPPPTTLRARTSLCQSPQRVRSRLFAPGFTVLLQVRRATPPNRVRYPAGCPFASGGSPPRLAATQLPSATCVVTPHDVDSHHADRTTSRTHRSAPKARVSKGGSAHRSLLPPFEARFARTSG
jgi:hypothetical protein